ncbi:hypothetical protein BC2230_21339 [Burkholderia cepacia]
MFAIEEVRTGGNIELRLNPVAARFSAQYGQLVIPDNSLCGEP